MHFQRADLAAGTVLAALCAVGYGQHGDPRAALQQQLIGNIALTKTTADRSDIVTPGAVVVLRKDNLVMCATASPLPPVNTYKKGKIAQGWGGLGREKTSSDYPKQSYVTGQKFWVTGILVNKDNISVVLYSDPDANNLRYYGQLNFPFKGAVPTADEAMKEIGEALTVQPAKDAASSGQLASAAAGGNSAPRPDAAGQARKTISVGQTKDQVFAILGQPQKVVHLGAQEIDYYQDMKITFVNGKVSDVE